MKQYFVTGTDTEVGKTYVTCHLLRAASNAKLKSVGYKPIAAGCDLVEGEWINEDAANIQKASGLALPISDINPIALMPPIAPHIAAQEAGVSLTQASIEKRAASSRKSSARLFINGRRGRMAFTIINRKSEHAYLLSFRRSQSVKDGRDTSGGYAPWLFKSCSAYRRSNSY